MENNRENFSEAPLTEYEKKMRAHSVETEPSIIRRYARPDGTTVDLRFFKNQFDGYYVSTEDSLGQGQKLHGNLEPDPGETMADRIEEYLTIWSQGLGYKEIKE